jgi:hypothetical protein
MDDAGLKEIQDKLKEFIGQKGVYVLMVFDGQDTRCWADGDSRLKMRGLLECGYDLLRDGLTPPAKPLPTDQN